MSEVNANDKYVRSIELMHVVNNGPKADLSATAEVQKQIYADITRLWDELYEFVHANFPQLQIRRSKMDDKEFSDLGDRLVLHTCLVGIGFVIGMLVFGS
jgi:hypothetical protein